MKKFSRQSSTCLSGLFVGCFLLLLAAGCSSLKMQSAENMNDAQVRRMVTDSSAVIYVHFENNYFRMDQITANTVGNVFLGKLYEVPSSHWMKTFQNHTNALSYNKVKQQAANEIHLYLQGNAPDSISAFSFTSGQIVKMHSYQLSGREKGSWVMPVVVTASILAFFTLVFAMAFSEGDCLCPF